MTPSSRTTSLAASPMRALVDDPIKQMMARDGKYRRKLWFR